MTSRRPVVGRRFRRWAVAVAVILLVIAAHAAWDLVEARRLLRVLAATAGPPVNAALPARPDPPRDAAPFYLAAAALAKRAPVLLAGGIRAGSDRERAEIYRLLRDGLETAEVPRETVLRLREFVDFHVEAFRLLDVATSLDFTRFPPGSGDEWAQLRGLKGLAEVRTVHAALEGRGEAATASLVAELGLDGGPDRPMTPLWPFLLARRTEAIRNVQIVLRRTRPTEAALARLADALANADYDEEWADYFARERDRDLESARMPWAYGAASGQVGLLSAGGPSWFKLWRPLSARAVRRLLVRYEELLTASRSPWPGRIAQVLAVTGPERSAISEGYVRFLTSASGWLIHAKPELQRRLLRSSALDLAGIRAARVAVAVERYRRAHGDALPAALDALVPVYLDALPIDPFSGESIRYRATGAEYVVYSVGINGKDDGGEQAEAAPWRSGPTGSDLRSSGDVGLRIPTAR